MNQQISSQTQYMRTFFIAIFLLLSIYFLFIKSELYESKTALIVSDLSTAPSASSLGLSLLGMGTSSQLQDSMIVEEYLKSLDVYKLLDANFNLTEHYKSTTLDIIERLPEDATSEDVLEFYNTRLVVALDEQSGILNVAFCHVDAYKAQEILLFLVNVVEKKINEFNRRKSIKVLRFVETEYEKAKKNMNHSSQMLEKYQNEHLLLDPSVEASSSSSIIAEMDAALLQKKIEYSTMSSYLNKNSYELKALKTEIDEIGRSIEKLRKKLTGESDTKLNVEIFAYEKLKLRLEFDTEVYKNALIQLETTRVEVQKDAKMLSVLSHPNLPDGYTYPNKPKVLVTLMIMMLLIYGILSMLNTVIRDHKE